MSEKFEMTKNETALMCGFLIKITDNKYFKQTAKKLFKEEDPALEGIDFDVFFNEDAFEKTNELTRKMLDFLVTNEEALAQME